MAWHTTRLTFLIVTAGDTATTVHAKIQCDLFSPVNIASLHTDFWNKWDTSHFCPFRELEILPANIILALSLPNLFDPEDGDSKFFWTGCNTKCYAVRCKNTYMGSTFIMLLPKCVFWRQDGNPFQNVDKSKQMVVNTNLKASVARFT